MPVSAANIHGSVAMTNSTLVQLGRRVFYLVSYPY